MDSKEIKDIFLFQLALGKQIIEVEGFTLDLMHGTHKGKIPNCLKGHVRNIKKSCIPKKKLKYL
jgi:hypothetical protein